MNIDPNNLPAECWVINREMVRAGRLPRRIVPTGASLFADKSVAGVREGKRGTYHSVGSLHATEAEAYTWAERCAAVELRLERDRFRVLEERLRAAFGTYHPRAVELRAQATTTEEPAA